MIYYKFEKPEDLVSIELELFNEVNQSKESSNLVQVSLIEESMNSFTSISLTKQNVQELIDALQVIQKQML